EAHYQQFGGCKAGLRRAKMRWNKGLALSRRLGSAFALPRPLGVLQHVREAVLARRPAQRAAVGVQQVPFVEFSRNTVDQGGKALVLYRRRTQKRDVHIISGLVIVLGQSGA